MRGRWLKVLTATSVAVILSGTVAAVGTAGAAVTGGSDATATCTFNGSSFPLLQGVKKGKTIAISCTGLPALHPYLIVEVSLLAAVDPQASAALSGNALSPTGLLGALAAVPEINIKAAAFPISDANGDLTENWKVPTSNPPDPNATCPPSKQQFNSGLLGCAIAMLDLTTAGPVDAGSALMEFKGYPMLPPSPTAAVSPTSASAGQTISLSDVSYTRPNKDTYWWLPTLVAEDALLGSAGGAPTVAVSVGGIPVDASNVSITTASYNGSVFTPPKLSGTITVPSGLSGAQLVHVSVSAPLLGLTLSNFALANLDVTG